MITKKQKKRLEEIFLNKKFKYNKLQFWVVITAEPLKKKDDVVEVMRTGAMFYPFENFMEFFE